MNPLDEYNKSKKSSDSLAETLFDAYADKKVRQENIEAIKKRRSENQSNNPTSKKEDEQSSGDSSSLEEKDGLKKEEAKDAADTEKKANDLEDKSLKKELDRKNFIDNVTGLGNLKKNWAKFLLAGKLALIAAGILLIIVGVLYLFSVVSVAIETFTNPITNFFGVSEKNSADNAFDGLYTSDKYMFDENGNEVNSIELVQRLKNDSNCSFSGWSYLTDWFTGSGFDGDQCKFIRYIQKNTIESDNNVDPSLIIATIFYGYDTQPTNTQYEFPEDIPEDQVPSVEHFDTLKQILTDNKSINKDMLDDIIENAYVVKNQTYYTWETTVDETTGNVIGTCKANVKSGKEYSLEKWKIFMRFGEEAAKEYDDYIDVGYLQESSSEECNGSISDEDLRTQLSSLGTGIITVDTAEARAAMEAQKQINSKLFCAADIYSKAKDDCSPYDYRNGFAYNHFLGYAPAYNNVAVQTQYDDIFTPKNIEVNIEEIVSKKINMNDVLQLDDPDSEGGSTTTIGPVVVGAYCKDYIETPLSELKVELRDCHGVYLDTVTFEDYIIGVANAEVSDKNDNYVLSEMLAAISYALRRRNNYSKGTPIMMKSGTCDQAYCSPQKGCTVKKNPEICSGCMSFYIGGSRGKNSKLYNKYKELYSVASQFLVVSKGKVHNAHYVSTIQNQWYKKASSGMAFTQIIKETYASEGAEVVKCSNGQVVGSEPIQQVVTTGRVGDTKTSEYPEVAPDKGKFYGYSYAEGSGNNIKINKLWIAENIVDLSPTCSNQDFANKTFRVHKDAVSNFNRAFDGICKLLTDGVTLSNGKKCKLTMNDLKGGTVFVEKKATNGYDDLHSYGIAQDWNYTASYTINGKKYTPYSSNATMESYWDFVEAINQRDGNSDLYDENNCSNVNYILYKYAYEGAGFSWGYGHIGKQDDNGNYISGSFNGKTFAIDY